MQAGRDQLLQQRPAVPVHDPLGLAGRAGGEEHPQRVVERHASPGRLAGTPPASSQVDVRVGPGVATPPVATVMVCAHRGSSDAQLGDLVAAVVQLAPRTRYPVPGDEHRRARAGPAGPRPRRARSPAPVCAQTAPISAHGREGDDTLEAVREVGRRPGRPAPTPSDASRAGDGGRLLRAARPKVSDSRWPSSLTSTTASSVVAAPCAAGAARSSASHPGTRPRPASVARRSASVARRPKSTSKKSATACPELAPGAPPTTPAARGSRSRSARSATPVARSQRREAHDPGGPRPAAGSGQPQTWRMLVRVGSPPRRAAASRG